MVFGLQPRDLWPGPVRARAHSGAAAAFASAPRPAPTTPWRQARWCAVDLELTGLDPRRDEIVAIGAVAIERGRPIREQTLYTLVRPSRPPRGPAVSVHRLGESELAGAPPLAAALEPLLALLAGRLAVFHTAAIERAFLGRALRALGLRLPAAADTEALGRLWLARRDGHAPERLGLGRLAALLGRPLDRPHHALADALCTAEAFVALAGTLDAHRPQTVASLTGPAATGAAWRRLGPAG